MKINKNEMTHGTGGQFRWSVKDGKPPKIFLSLNFTSDLQNVEISLEPIKLHWKIDPVSGESRLSIKEM